MLPDFIPTCAHAARISNAVKNKATIAQDAEKLLRRRAPAFGELELYPHWRAEHFAFCLGKVPASLLIR